jgi:hypothetical protein
VEVNATFKQLIFDFFSLCELEPLEIRRGIWQVNADDALMKELDGWRARGRLLQFTFEPDLAETFGADLIVPGSYRLNSIVQLVRRQGLLSRAHIPHHFFHEPSIRQKAMAGLNPGGRTYVVNSSIAYGQYIMLKIFVRLKGLSSQDSIHTRIVDLSDARVLRLNLPTHLLQPGGVDETLLRKRKYGLKKAYNAAVENILADLDEQGHDWTLAAWERLEEEKGRLREYFENQSDSPAYEAKLQEVKTRLMPTIQMNAIRAAFIYVPLFQYRLILVRPDKTETSQNLSCDPISSLCLFH